MKLKVFKILIILCFNSLFSQENLSGVIISESTNLPLENVTIFNSETNEISYSDSDGKFIISINNIDSEINFFLEGYNLLSKIFGPQVSESNNVTIRLAPRIEELNEVVVRANLKKIFQIKRFQDVEGTRIYAGKKNEVILIDVSMANLASNNARQIYNQIPGLNIYQNDDAGLQLNIGGRGLNPNRTANFNTRQNNYDISADALGYPESYYTPPPEGLEEIQILRGAASLQYGTQFGGLINFKIKKPKPEERFELITRNTAGSNNLFTNFTSVSSSNEKSSYYGYVNYKNGAGFRPNSEFESINTFQNFNYNLNEKSKITGEITYMEYLAHQAGGLSDFMFANDPFQSNRERNWFEIKWFLYNLKYLLQISEDSSFSFNFFGLDAQRNSLGFRTNRVDQIDYGEERDLIKGDFKNFGFESRYLTSFNFLNKKSYLLLGAKYYNSFSQSVQGPGSSSKDADFNFDYINFPNYINQSEYSYPNNNLAIFGENIFYINESLSITPGFRFENINTSLDGYYRKINLDAAGNTIYNERFDESDTKKRKFLLLGLGLSYKKRGLELYTNFSQNFRSVTFADISIINPAYSINPNIDDEKGYTFDLGFRGNYRKIVSFDSSIFALIYRDRIGFIQKAFRDGNVKSERGNVGNAQITGVESLFDFDINEILFKNEDIDFNVFLNYSYIESKYLKSNEVGIAGKEVEFVPKNNFKTGLKFGYKDFAINFQYSYLSSQFTDSSNAISGNLSGVIGQIPSYEIADLSMSYKLRNIKFEAGVNNLFDEIYFTRRATGYPGPGIIPSPPRNSYITLEIKL
jgi:Fe(3+) dicitrate transport protein